MINWIFNRIQKQFPGAQALGAIRFVSILAVVTVITAGSAQAIHTRDGGKSGFLMAANDAKAADAIQKDTKTFANAKPATENGKTASRPAEKSYGMIGSFFIFLKHQPFVFIMLALALGYSLGLKVGPQFFSGLKSGGIAYIAIGLIVWSLNWIICFVGVKLAGLAPGFLPGIISGSYTITAIIGVAQSAVSSGAYTPPQGISPEQIGANIAEGVKMVGPESDDPMARDVPIEAADIRIGSHKVAGKTLSELGKTMGFGLQLKALFRLGEEMPILAGTKVQVGYVLRVVGPDFCVQQSAKTLGGKPILDNAVTEVMYMA